MKLPNGDKTDANPETELKVSWTELVKKNRNFGRSFDRGCINGFVRGDRTPLFIVRLNMIQL